jgi:hypothetical protein
LIIPMIAASPVFLLAWIWGNYAFWPLLAALGVIPTAAISIMMAFFVMFFVVYFPLLGLLGGFDDSMFYIFKKAVAISGPSKPMLTILLKEIGACIKVSRRLHIHGRFGIPYKEAYKEIEELMVMKQNGTFVIGGNALK